jgi:electron transfer flavoprotein-quinone oxidoreductase
MERFDAIVVGGGLAGCASALVMARNGLSVLLFERGPFAGAKNMWGGAFFGPQLDVLVPKFKEEAPIERFATRRTLSFMSEKGSVALEYESPPSQDRRHHGFIVMRARFDKWLAGKVEQAGAIVAAGMRVDDLLFDSGKIVGVKVGSEEFNADVVILAEGVNAVLTQRAGLRGEHAAEWMKQGVKEVIRLSRETIDDRFNLSGMEGAAMEFVGACTRGMPGGGFLYTNGESLSLGLVVDLGALVKNRVKASDLLEEFKSHPSIARLIRGGTTAEYSAHLIPTAGLRMMPKLFAGGVLATGDAAGLVLGTGLILEGANFAVASGVAAAETAVEAKRKKDFSMAILGGYEARLRGGFVLKDMHTFRRSPDLLKNPRIYGLYPEVVSEIAEAVFQSDGEPRTEAYRTARGIIKRRVGIARFLADLWAMRNMT